MLEQEGGKVVLWNSIVYEKTSFLFKYSLGNDGIMT